MYLSYFKYFTLHILSTSNFKYFKCLKFKVPKMGNPKFPKKQITNEILNSNQQLFCLSERSEESILITVIIF